jgi:hypothetical protein
MAKAHHPPAGSRPRRRKRELLNREQLLAQLEPVSFTGGSAEAKEAFERLNLSDMLLVLADVSHPTEYAWCGQVALHLLGVRPDADAEYI